MDSTCHPEAKLERISPDLHGEGRVASLRVTEAQHEERPSVRSTAAKLRRNRRDAASKMWNRPQSRSVEGLSTRRDQARPPPQSAPLRELPRLGFARGDSDGRGRSVDAGGRKSKSAAIKACSPVPHPASRTSPVSSPSSARRRTPPAGDRYPTAASRRRRRQTPLPCGCRDHRGWLIVGHALAPDRQTSRRFAAATRHARFRSGRCRPRAAA